MSKPLTVARASKSKPSTAKAMPGSTSKPSHPAKRKEAAVLSNPALYAVVSPARKAPAATTTRTRSIAAVRDERTAELKAKRAIDRSNALLDRLETRQANLRKQVAQLQKRISCAGARAQRIEDKILEKMLKAGLEKADGFHVTFATRNAPASLIVDSEADIPAEYFREKLVSSVDKNAIKTAMAKGDEVPGCHLETKLSLVRK
jgi:hypothetical protein